MKKLYFLLLLVIGTFSANAQIVNIPDPVFKQILLETQVAYIDFQPVLLDANQDGEVQVSEALTAVELYVLGNVTSMEGIEYFTNVAYLYILETPLTSVDISALTSLTDFHCSNNTLLTTLNFNAENLFSLTLNNNGLTALDLSTFANNDNFSFDLDLSYNQLTSIDLSPLAGTTINTVILSHNKIQSFDFSGLDGGPVGTLDLSYNEITDVDFSTLNQNMYSLDISYNLYDHLDYQGLSHLQYLTIGGGGLNSVKFANINFEYINILGDTVNVLDFKNGINESCFSIFVLCMEAPGIGIVTNPGIVICTDDFPDGDPEGQDKSEANFFNLRINGFEDFDLTDNAQVTTYCSFEPGGEYNTISGNVKFDCGNANLNAQGISINAVQGVQFGYNQTNASGNYIYYATTNNVTVAPQLEFPSYFNVTPPNYNYNFPVSGNSEIADFCLTPNGIHHNLEVTLVPYFLGNPGFDAVYDLVYTNNGNQAESGTVSLNFNDSILDFVSANPVVSTQSINTLSWDYSSLLPFESRTIRVTVNLNSPMETPAINMGDILNYTANVTSGNVDETPADNTFTLNQTVVNSIDPNNKTVTEGSQVSIANVGDYLHYVVRFQNNGTASAQNVVVKDYLDIDLDWSTVEPIAASHDYRMQLTNNNRLEFIFEGINLPASSIDEPGSNGYIAFKVKPKSTASVGTVITNEAGIYFDFNFPIMTNTTTTTFSVLGTEQFVHEAVINLYPNPTSNMLNIESDNAGLLKSVSIYNVLGQLVKNIANTVATKNMTIDVASVKTGTYFVTVEAENGKSTKRFIKL